MATGSENAMGFQKAGTQVKMKLGVLKHIVLTFLGSQGATQGPKHRKSKFSAPRPPHPPKIYRAIPEGEVGGRGGSL